MPQTSAPVARRPLKSRDQPLFQRLAAFLARVGATPNGISMMSLVCGIVAGLAFAITSIVPGIVGRIFFILAAVSIQLRLLCNLIDGMVAVEHRRRSATGEVWNEVPDRFSDIVTIIGAGFAAGGVPFLGFVGAILAVLTAYVRALGASLGAGQVFKGVGGKPQRMAILTFAALIAAITGIWGAITLGLLLVCGASAVTVAQRLAIIRLHLIDRR